MREWAEDNPYLVKPNPRRTRFRQAQPAGLVQPHCFAHLVQDVVHGALCSRRVPAGNGGGYFLVGVERLGPRLERHEALMGTAGEDLGHHPFKGREHFVAAALQQQPVIGDVGREERLKLSGLA
jgi:hypothetical protein